MSSGERKRMRLNRVRGIPGRGCGCGVVGARGRFCPDWRGVINPGGSRRLCEGAGVEGNTPVGEIPGTSLRVFPSSTGPVKSRVNLAGPPAKPKYFLVTDSGLVP